jgi:hypothetical protein
MSMLLAGENGTEFELGLIEETLDEDLQDGDGDDKTVTLSFRVATREEEWEETAPCLNTFEVNNLVEWLEGVATRRPDPAELELLEPELRFSVVGDRGEQVTLRIDFHIKDRPENLDVDAPTDADHIDIKLDRKQVRAATGELKRDLEELHLAKREMSSTQEQMEELAAPEEDLNLLDQIESEPPGAGEGEDNAGER